MNRYTRPLTDVADAWANKDASGFELLHPISEVWWSVEAENDTFVGDCILRNSDVPFVSVALWSIDDSTSWVRDVGVDIESCWEAVLLRFLVLFEDISPVLLTDVTAFGVDSNCCWVTDWGVIDLCCFSICSTVWAAGCDINRASKGLLSFVAVAPEVGWSPALKCPVLT